MTLSFPRRFSLSVLLALVVISALTLGVRQAVYVPVARRAEAARRLEELGLKLERRPPAPSWRDFLFPADDLLEVVSVEAVAGNLPDGALEGLGRFPGLTTVRLRGCDVADAVHLARIERLSVLDVANTRIGDVGLARLAACPLTDVDLLGTRVTADGLESLAKMTTLRRIVLPHGIDHDRLAALAPLTRLTVLLQEHADITAPALRPETAPTELGRLPLVACGIVWNFHDDWQPRDPLKDLKAEPLPADLVDAPLSQPAVPWGCLADAKLIDPTPEAWRALVGRPRLRTITLAGDSSGLDLDGLTLPSGVETLTVSVGTLTAGGLRSLLAVPGETGLTIVAERFDVSPEDFVAAVTGAPARQDLTISAPVNFGLMPGIDRVASDASMSNIMLTGMPSHEDEYRVRWKGRPRTIRVGPSRPYVNEPRPVPPDWQTAAMLARGEGYVINYHFGSPKSRDLAAWTAWFGHPTAREVGSMTSPSVTEEMLAAAVANPAVTKLDVRGPFIDDGWLAKMLELPNLTELRVTGGGLTDAALDLVEAKPSLAPVALASPRFSDAVLDRYKWPDGLPKSRPPTGRSVTARLEYVARADGPLGGRLRRDADFAAFMFEEPSDPAIWEPLARRFPGVTCYHRSFSIDSPPWDELRAFPAVRHLSLNENTDHVRVDGWAGGIPNLSSLVSLGLRQSQINGPDPAPTGLAWLTPARALEFLSIGTVPVTADGLAVLATLPELRELHLTRVVGQSGGGPSDVAFLGNGQAWKSLVTPSLRLTSDEVARLAAPGSLEVLACDGVLLGPEAVPALEALLKQGAAVFLDRPDLDRPTLARLRQLAAAEGGQFDTVIPSHLVQVFSPIHKPFGVRIRAR